MPFASHPLLLSNNSEDFPGGLANKMLFLYGDSNEHNAVKMLCQLSTNSTLSRVALVEGKIVIAVKNHLAESSFVFLCVQRLLFMAVFGYHLPQ